jgi:hypothetical protein
MAIKVKKENTPIKQTWPPRRGLNCIKYHAEDWVSMIIAKGLHKDFNDDYHVDIGDDSEVSTMHFSIEVNKRLFWVGFQIRDITEYKDIE